MGLDQYLSVRRRFPRDHAVTTTIFDTLGLDWETLATNDAGGYHYLPLWEWYPEAERDLARFALQTAELYPLLTADAPSGFLQVEDDTLVVSVNAGYWGKANAIHGWFVDNVQGGVDDCNLYPVDIEQLAELRERCIKVLDNPDLALDLLPPRGGVFFGSTNIDERYLDHLDHTARMITDVVGHLLAPDTDRTNVSIAYCSSW